MASNSAKAKIRKDSTALIGSEVVTRHSDLLRKCQPGTIAKYRRMAPAHIDGSELGRTAVDRVTKAAVIVIGWMGSLSVRALIRL